jgi:thiamine biosynthesis lipoprotein
VENKFIAMKNFLPLFALLLVACDTDNYLTFSDYAQGTTYTVTVKNPPENLDEKIDAVFEDIDFTFSIFNPASLTSRINRGETDTTTALFERCFALVKDVHARTEGFYDPTVKPLVDAWGFGPEPRQEIPDIETIMEYVGLDKIYTQKGRIIKSDPRVQLDFSSIAKGLTVDLLAELLETENVTDYMVEVGGEVRTKGVNESGRAWRIGIDKPVVGLTRTLETVAVPTGALPAIATSGNYRNQFVDTSGRTRVHTIDPTTGLATDGELLSVSIAAAECALADAFATGLMASHTIENARRILAAIATGTVNATGTANPTSTENGTPGTANAVPTPAPFEYYIIYSAPANAPTAPDNASTAPDAPTANNSRNAAAVFRSPGFPLEK